MAISKKGFRKINVEGDNFYWKVRKKVSHEEAHDDQYGIPIQHESEGQLLFVFVGFCRSKGYGRESINNITPNLIRLKILEAIELGWKYKKPGNLISFVNRELTSDTKTAKWLQTN
ncbi:hypothetical protein [Aureibacter tunicatorum]|uniref:Uncharacterized protein n=1 Tax=Aureibacter tunicatorum TaxID=866807 RepID=A0AAE3XR29_9BACT|nr:hypothetical protein [Aureibacter tunicatorum]MDR6241115.1 hypothetical protein [Aureibacter tunicatorum]BDD03893.1 hypothetical protein AUTU_13760 [Aureibacter tunicatorum]